MKLSYRGRFAPSPTGYLHVGHASTFWVAQQRASMHGGVMVLRNEDLDRSRCRPEFLQAMFEDMRWFGLTWQEGPDCGGPSAPYSQSRRFEHYQRALAALRRAGLVYPCTCSRQDVLRALQAPHQGEDEPIYPGTCRERNLNSAAGPVASPVNWRFRVPEYECIEFTDGYHGPQRFRAGTDFGDFLVWRQDNSPAYQLAVVVDDALMRITEIVRGADLLKSTARQLLLYRALGYAPPAFCHCPLVIDDAGNRLAKRHDSLSLRALRAHGITPEEIRTRWNISWLCKAARSE